MDQRASYLDNGYDKNLQRGEGFGSGGVQLAEGQLPSGGTYNGTTALVEGQTQPSDTASGETAEHLIIAADGHIRGGATDYLEGEGFWLGSFEGDKNDYRFFVGDAAGDYLTYANGVLTISGTFSATSGVIGGFDIGTDYVRDVANSSGLASTVTGGDDVRFWAGETFANRASAPFRVYESGAMVATNATITLATLGGFDIGADYIRDAANSSGMASTVTGGDDVRFWAGDTFANRASAPFRVTEAGILTAVGAVISIASLGGFDIGSDYIRDTANSFGLASTVTGGDDVRFWAGAAFASRATAPFRVYESGDVVFGDSSTGAGAGWDQSTGEFTARGTLSLSEPFTMGWDMTQGEVSAIESDGFVYPARYIASATVIADAEFLTTAGSAHTRGDAIIVGHNETSGSLKCTALGVSMNGGNVIYTWSDVVDDPVAYSAIDDGVVAAGSAGRLCQVLTTTALCSYLSGTTATGIVLSGLDQAVTVNGATTISTNAATPHVVRYSDTVVAAVYIDTGTGDLNARILTVGATSFTASAATTLVSTVGALIWDIKRFGKTDFFMVTYEDTSGNQTAVCFEFDGSTFTAGTPLVLLATTANVEFDIDGLDSTRMIAMYVATTNVNTTVVSRSGTTLSNGTPVAIATTAAAGSGLRGDVIGLGADSFAFAFQDNTNAGLHGIGRVEGTVPSLIGSLMSIEAANPIATGSTAPLHCLRINPKYYGLFFQDSGANLNLTYTAYAPGNTFAQAIGIQADTAVETASGGVILQGYSDDVSGLQTASAYYVGVDGALLTRTEGGLRRIGIALSATTFKVE